MVSESFGVLPKAYRLLEYEFQGILGQGGFGVTYLAIDLNLNKKVAIKEYFPREFAGRDAGQTIRPAGNKDDRETFEWGLKRFLDEARTLALFEDPNIISVKRFFEANGTAYLVMDYCDGLPLDEVIRRDGPLSEKKLILVLRPLLSSLAKIHSTNFLHRDIKPANIFIRSDGSPVLLDFGSARQLLSENSRTMTSLASAGYAPFEQYALNGKQGPWTDIYSLGMTMYRAMTGDKPQGAPDRILEDNIVPLQQRLSGSFNQSLLAGLDSAIEVKPVNRPQSIEELRKILFPTNTPINTIKFIPNETASKDKILEFINYYKVDERTAIEMINYKIWRQNDLFIYKTYRYEKLEDAIAYARIEEKRR